MKKLIALMLLIPLVMTGWVALKMHTDKMIAEKVLMATLVSYLLIPMAGVIIVHNLIKSRKTAVRKLTFSKLFLALVSLTGLPVPISNENQKQKEWK